jgi:hypothetical protein
MKVGQATLSSSLPLLVILITAIIATHRLSLSLVFVKKLSEGKFDEQIRGIFFIKGIFYLCRNFARFINQYSGFVCPGILRSLNLNKRRINWHQTE